MGNGRWLGLGQGAGPIAGMLMLASLAAPSLAQEMSLDDARKLALELVNKSRAEQKLPPLKLEPKLTKAAQTHADDMYKRNFYSHNSPEGKTVSDRFQAAGGSKWLLTAENIAKCEGCRTPLQEPLVRQMHEGWMNSPGHRANILRKGLDSLGYGVVVDTDGKLYAVQTFSGPGTPAATSAADAKPASPAQQLDMVAGHVNAKRKAAGRKPIQPSQGLVLGAQAIAPAPGDASFKLRHSDDLMSALPQAEKQKWQSLSMLAAQCGGCGVETVAGDVNAFTGQWLGDAKMTKMLLDGDITHFGFAIVADGKGRKVAVGLLGGGSD
jgi:uncharacterized protein YkwD